MSILAIIWWIITNLPSILSVVRAVIDFIRGIKDPAVHAKAMAEFSQALKTVRVTGKPDAVNSFAEKWCPSIVGCPSDLK